MFPTGVKKCFRSVIEAGFAFLAVLAIGCAVYAPGIAAAQELTTNTPLCHLQKLRIGGWQGIADEYSIKARTLPPDRVMRPGETYEIRYEIVSRCDFNLNCVDFKPVYLSHRAVLGADRSRLDTTQSGIGSTHVEQHRCGVVPTRITTFTVPDPKSLGATGNSAEVAVSIGICPPDARWNCAGHTIRVRNAPTGEWKLSAPSVRVRTLSGEFPAGRPIPMSVDVTNLSGRHRWPADPGSLTIKVAGPFPTAVVSSVNLPPVSDVQSTAVGFSVTPAAPGHYLYSACLTGLNGPNGYPLPDICGAQTTVIVSAATQNQLPPQGGNPPLPGGGQPLPGTAAMPEASNCTGGRFPDPTGRCVCPGGTRWSAAANQCATPHGGAPRLLPPPGDAAPLPAGALPPPVQTCTGGRLVDSQGRCVCPAGTQWNAGASQCVTPQAAAPAGQLQCLGGEVKGILCWCGIGRFPKAVGNNIYQCQ